MGNKCSGDKQGVVLGGNHPFNNTRQMTPSTRTGMMDFYDMAERIDGILSDLRLQQADPELEGEVADLIRELSTIADVLYTLYPVSFNTVEDRKTQVLKLWAKANNERGRF